MNRESRVNVTITVGPYALDAIAGHRGVDGEEAGVIIKPEGEPLAFPIALAYASGVAAALEAVKKVRNPWLKADLPDVMVNFDTVADPLELPQSFPEPVAPEVLESDAGEADESEPFDLYGNSNGDGVEL